MSAFAFNWLYRPPHRMVSYGETFLQSDKLDFDVNNNDEITTSSAIPTGVVLIHKFCAYNCLAAACKKPVYYGYKHIHVRSAGNLGFVGQIRCHRISCKFPYFI